MNSKHNKALNTDVRSDLLYEVVNKKLQNGEFYTQKVMQEEKEELNMQSSQEKMSYDEEDKDEIQ